MTQYFKLIEIDRDSFVEATGVDCPCRRVGVTKAEKKILREMQGLLVDINRVEIVSHLLDGTLLSWLSNWKMRMGMLLEFLIENGRCKNERL